jgi:hypothetical protein
MIHRLTVLGLLSVVGALTPSSQARAQPAQDTSAAHDQHQHGSDESMAAFPTRDASGTSWLPDETPMYGVLRNRAGWDVMLHGVAFAQVIFEPGDVHRTGGFSSRQVSSTNWGMVMARRPLGSGRVGIRGMVSTEPWTVPGCGYLSLLATGETCEGDTIHDRQHPHDLFMELAADYDRPLRRALRWQLYAGFAGEPALGPPGFPHRTSAMLNPIAPISHHWLDSTHITFGLVTIGVYDHRWKAEASMFNGREPDEERRDLDLGPLDSISGRITFLPSDRVALQVSAGHLREAEAEFPPDPRSDVNKATASATYHRPLEGNGFWATTLAYGLNSGRENIPTGVLEATTQAILLESSITVRARHTWFGRAEVVEKPAHDLHAHEYATEVFTVGKVQGGYVRQFESWKGLVAGVGASASASLVPPQLASRYHGRVTPGFNVFLTVRPPRHVM